jgi:hypothetical protein
MAVTAARLAQNVVVPAVAVVPPTEMRAADCCRAGFVGARVTLAFRTTIAGVTVVAKVRA